MALLNVGGAVNVHDPEIVKENGVYYRFCTGQGIAVAKSVDLITWEDCEPVFKENPLWTSKAIPGSTWFWAPDVTWHESAAADGSCGEWRLYYSVSTFGSQKSAIGLCVNKTLNPASPDFCWQDLGCVLQSDETCAYNAIDPAVFSGEDSDYLLFGSFWGGLFAVPLTAQGFVVKDAVVTNIATRNTNPNPVEGGFVFKHEGFYYLFASYDFCCRGTASSYHIVSGRSENPLGPYTDMFGKPFLEGGGDTLRDSFSFERWAGPGHNSVFKDDDGKIYLVYHAYDRNDDGKSCLMIEELFFEDGFPSVKE